MRTLSKNIEEITLLKYFSSSQPVPVIFSSLPFYGIPPHSSPHLFSADFSSQPINRQSRISRFLPLRATTFLRWFPLGFVTPDPVPLTSPAVLFFVRLPSSSSSSLLFGQPDTIVQSVFSSTRPLPRNRRPRRFKQHDRLFLSQEINRLREGVMGSTPGYHGMSTDGKAVK